MTEALGEEGAGMSTRGRDERWWRSVVGKGPLLPHQGRVKGSEGDFTENILYYGLLVPFSYSFSSSKYENRNPKSNNNKQ